MTEKSTEQMVGKLDKKFEGFRGCFRKAFLHDKNFNNEVTCEMGSINGFKYVSRKNNTFFMRVSHDIFSITFGQDIFFEKTIDFSLTFRAYYKTMLDEKKARNKLIQRVYDYFITKGGEL